MNRGEELFAAASGWDLNTLKHSSILVAGVGALGNEALKNLALLGAGRLILVDFDEVEAHNLSRSVLFEAGQVHSKMPKVEAAAENLMRLNPDLQLVVLRGDLATDLGLGLLQTASVALGCLDNRLARLYLNRLCWRAGIPWVDGGILQLGGHVCAYVPGDSCYECQLSEGEWRDIRVRMGCADIAQRFSHSGRMPTTPIAASVIGAIQVQEALKLIHLPVQERKGGVLFSYEGSTLSTGLYQRMGLKDNCLAHFERVDAVEASNLGHDSTAKELSRFCLEELGMSRPRLRLNHDLIRIIRNGGEYLLVPKHRLYGRVLRLLGLPDSESWVAGHGNLVQEVILDEILKNVPLWALGIPFSGILEVVDSDKKRSVLLAKDRVGLESSGRFFRVPDPWLDLNDEYLSQRLSSFSQKT